MKKLLIIFLLFCLCLPLVVGATTSEEAQLQERRKLIDGADLLSISEEAELLTLLNKISGELDAEIAVVTADTIDGRDIDGFINEFYDESGYGYGTDKSGVLLLVCMDIREYRILSNGEAGDAVTEYEIDRIGEAFSADLSDGNYADAFETYAQECGYYISGYQNGYHSEYEYENGGTFDLGTHLLIALVIGLVVGGIVILVLVGQLRSVRKQTQANAYIRQGSLQITQSGDYYMYRNVTRTPRPQNNSSGGGGGSRMGGGGSRHTGGGRF